MSRKVTAPPLGRHEAGAQALWYTAPGRVELRSRPLDLPRPGDALVKTLFTGISRGTERLVLSGAVGASEWSRMQAPMQEGSFPFPVKYGYCAVGQVEMGPEALRGHTVFALSPHQDWIVTAPERLTVVPDNVPARRATLAANMETALNALWDSGAGPADRIVVVGAGVVGLLVGYLAARLPGAEVTVVDIDPRAPRDRRKPRLPLRRAGNAAPSGADVVFHTSVSAAGLNLAIDCAGFEATVVELSWYGDRDVPGTTRRRLPQPAPEARLVAGRQRRDEPARAMGLREAHVRRDAPAGRSPPRRTRLRGDQVRDCRDRAAAHPRPRRQGPRARDRLLSRGQLHPLRRSQAMISLTRDCAFGGSLP